MCTVCEDDPRTRIESVMVFPRKAKKNAPREETIAIALVEAQGMLKKLSEIIFRVIFEYGVPFSAVFFFSCLYLKDSPGCMLCRTDVSACAAARHRPARVALGISCSEGLFF